MSEIAVYVEGGGDTAGQKAELRQGFDALFAREKSKAAEKSGSLRFICCGGRREAYEAFMYAVAVKPHLVNALLVDSETSIAPIPADHGQDAQVRLNHLSQTRATDSRGQGDGWQFTGVPPERIHLMVQCMEAWIVSDPDALEGFYKQEFRRARLPARNNLEDEPKIDVYAKLGAATANTQKGQYAKIRHASKILLLIDPEKVGDRCPRFSIFRDWLNESIDLQPASWPGIGPR